MKTVLMTMAAIVGTAGAAQASEPASPMVATPRIANALHACEHADREGFCGLTLIRTQRTPTVVPATLNDQGRAQLNRLIASLR